MRVRRMVLSAVLSERVRGYQRRGDMRTKYFHLDRKFPELSRATQEQAEDEWDEEIDKMVHGPSYLETLF
eukprot:1542296-Rhodomonas_salina.3